VSYSIPVSSNPCCLPQSPSCYTWTATAPRLRNRYHTSIYHHLFEHHWDCPNHNSTAPDRGSSSCSLFASSSRTKHAPYSSQSRFQILDPALVGHLKKNHKDATIRIFSSTLSICIFYTLPSNYYSCETRVVTIILCNKRCRHSFASKPSYFIPNQRRDDCNLAVVLTPRDVCLRTSLQRCPCAS